MFPTHNRESNMPLIVREVKKTKLLTSFHPHKGHTCFELNKVTGEIKPAAISEVNCDITGGIRRKIIVNDNCIYASALNITNAQKKFFSYMRASH